MLFIIWMLFLLACVIAVYISDRRKADYPRVFSGFWQALKDAFISVRGLLVLFGSVILTVLLIVTGLEEGIQIWFQTENPLGKTLPLFFLIGGNFWHPIIGIVIYLLGRIKRSNYLLALGAGTLQAIIANGLVINGLKWLTGRRGPAKFLTQDGFDQVNFSPRFIKSTNSADFGFDFWNHTFLDGRFFWPSGHTSTAFAFIAAWTYLFLVYNRLEFKRSSLRKTKFFAIEACAIGFLWLVAFLTGLAMIDGDFHWCSDVLVGAGIGFLIGRQVAKTLHKAGHEAP